MTRMHDGTCWLAISRRERSDDTGDLSVRLSRRKPALARGEIAVRLALRVPGSLFEEPVLQAAITLPDGAGGVAELDLRALEHQVHQATGLDIRIEDP